MIKDHILFQVCITLTSNIDPGFVKTIESFKKDNKTKP